MSIASPLSNWITSPGVLRFGFGVLRRVMPVLRLGKNVIVTRHDDVMEVLTRDRDFTIRQINDAKMEEMLVPFYLGMDRSPQHDREFDLVARAVRREDLARIEEMVRVRAAAIIDGVRSTGQIEAVNVLTRAVPQHIVDMYFGIPGDVATMNGWMRSLFWQIFLNRNDEKVHAAALKAAAALKEHMLGVIAQRKAELAAGADIGDTVLARMVREQAEGHEPWLDDDTIRRNVAGLILGAEETTSKVVILALDELLRRPDQLRRAADAALRNDIPAVQRFVLEALRFNPHNPVILRHASGDQMVGAARGKGKRIPDGSTVYAATLGAMFDPAAFPDPKSFMPDRRNEYLHYSYGLHACTGRYINTVQIPELLAALLRLPNLRRAASGGNVTYEGVFPQRMELEFDRG